ncbi:hypothetical protein [Paracoccus sp. Ld10]|uniref:hypothetical protein n=1 Tax=Paracoccus sp. Ld10 TaxID=649158 RepID=UPI00386E8E9D
MSKWLPALLACLILAPSVSLAQNALPAYQPAAVRQICKAAPVSDTPGGAEVGRVAAGDAITVTDLSLDADGNLHFQYGDATTPRFIASGAARNFCGYGERAAASPTAFLAPPNTCHVIAASRRTLDDVNLFAADYPAYAQVMNVFRSQNGWYAVSLGLISNQIVGQVLSEGPDIPYDAYCSDGANYFEVMDWQDGRFSEPSPPPPADPRDRRREADALFTTALEGDDAEGLRRACLLGNGSSCGHYANLLRQPKDPSDNEVEQITRFDLLGCMLGEPVACNNALFGKSFRNKAVFATFPNRTGAASAPPVLDPELAKIGCDAGLATSCYELAKPAIQYGSKDVTTYLTSVEAMFYACTLKQDGYCRDFAAQMDYRRTVMDSDWPPLVEFGAARVIAGACDDADSADSQECRLTYGRYRRFLESDDGSDDQRRTAVVAIRRGCDAGGLTACAYQSTLSDQFTNDERRTAAAKVRAACDVEKTRGDICDRLATALGDDLPEAQDPIRAEYERRAMTCRTTEGTDGSNPCSDALWYYGGHVSLDDLSVPLALLHETCRAGGKITGCGPLYRYYDGEELLFAGDGVRARFPKRPQKALEVLQIGCAATLEGVGNCGSLGLMLEQTGDFTAAAEAYATGCNTGMTGRTDQYYGQGRVCFWAGENAYNTLRDYANARRWLGFSCYAYDNPYACTYLGLMHAKAEGGPADQVAAAGLYRMGCDMPAELGQRDGQACLLYGQALVAQRETALADAPSVYGDPVIDDEERDAVIAQNLTEASRAYLRACTEEIADACTAHATMLRQWSDGAYPRYDLQCRVIDAQGTMAPAKTCQMFLFYLPAPDGNSDDGWTNVFVWPDGDRTVMFGSDGEPTLNGVPGTWIRPESGWDCIQSSATGRSFCYAAI